MSNTGPKVEHFVVEEGTLHPGKDWPRAVFMTRFNRSIRTVDKDQMMKSLGASTVGAAVALEADRVALSAFANAAEPPLTAGEAALFVSGYNTAVQILDLPNSGSPIEPVVIGNVQDALIPRTVGATNV